MRADEEAQAVGVSAEEAMTSANGEVSPRKSSDTEKLAHTRKDGVTTEDRIEVKLEGKEHPWNWTKTR